MIELGNENMYGAFRTLAPSLWGPFLLRPHRFTTLPGGHLMSFDVTSSPLWILILI